MKGIMVNAMLISGNGQKQTYVFTSQFGINYIIVSFLELNRVYYNDCIYEADSSKRHAEMYRCRCQGAGLNLAISRAADTFSQD